MTERETERLEKNLTPVQETDKEEPAQEVVDSYYMLVRCEVCDMLIRTLESPDPEHIRQEIRDRGWSDSTGEWRCEVHKEGATGMRKYDIGG